MQRKRDKNIATIVDKMYNANQDPLHKTLIIIDEAHNLVEGDEDKYQSLLTAFHRSFQQSQEDSCKVVLMTATPITTNPLQAIHCYI